MIKHSILLPVMLLLALSACEPIGPLPGTSLAGNVEPAPENWSALDTSRTIQLETLVDKKPYSVNIWGVGLGQYYYVASAKGAESRWAKRIARNNQVRLRIDQSIFELTAIIVTDQAERDKAALAFQHKYDIEQSEDFPDAIVYRLEEH
jgi:hypothetical protein